MSTNVCPCNRLVPSNGDQFTVILDVASHKANLGSFRVVMMSSRLIRDSKSPRPQFCRSGEAREGSRIQDAMRGGETKPAIATYTADLYVPYFVFCLGINI